MKRKIVQLLLDGLYNNEEFGKTADKILSLMGEKEIGDSDALPSNGDLHSVRECNVSDEVSNKKASVNGSLEKITEAKEVCKHLPLGKLTVYHDNSGICPLCKEIVWQNGEWIKTD